ncbi:hypothetical protein [Nonomuraea sp. NPDC046570]|uniref:hypothetical protein n=1 Tax=Nonomuraea sp. NPDC046570 TaxID=3155255 RepID=UPI0033D766A2
MATTRRKIVLTAVPVFARPPRARRSTGELIASTEITAGWHHSAGDDPPEYGYGATLTVAARARPVSGSFPVWLTYVGKPGFNCGGDQQGATFGQDRRPGAGERLAEEGWLR